MTTEHERAVAEALDRIDATNPSINALSRVLRDEALVAARQSTSSGSIAGVPISIKSNIDVAGSATDQGVVALAEAVPSTDAPLVARLRRAGAIVVARSNMPDFALRWHTDNGAHGATVNPWDARRTAGGSSGGDAAALAAGLVPLAIGNDYGGSLRIPAAACGIASFKPSTGRVPNASTLPGPPPTITLQHFAVHGPMATSLGLLRAAFDAMAGPHPDDPWSSVGAVARQRSGAPRIGVMAVAADESVNAALEASAATLRDAGHEVVSIDELSILQGAAAWLALLSHDVATYTLPAISPIISDDTRQFVVDLLDFGSAAGLPTPDEAWFVRHAVALAWSQAFADLDAVLTPVSAIETPLVGFDLGGPVAVGARWQSLAATLTVNLLGLPALAWPIHRDGALPTAVQLIGARNTDEQLFDIAAPLAAAHPVPIAR